jgi:hypothetical protein
MELRSFVSLWVTVLKYGLEGGAPGNLYGYKNKRLREFAFRKTIDSTCQVR